MGVSVSDKWRMTADVQATISALQAAQKRGVQRSALEVTNTIRTEIRQVAGADMRLSGAGRGGKGAKVGARFDIKGVVNPTALVKANGPIQLIERDTQPHMIMARSRFVTRGGKRVRQGMKSAAGKRLRGKTALTIGGNLRRWAAHPGTKGREPFTKGVEKAAPKTPLIYQAEVDKELRRIWA